MNAADGRVWHVYSYPDDESLHTAPTYEEADRWRRTNNELTYIAPQWPEEVSA